MTVVNKVCTPLVLISVGAECLVVCRIRSQFFHEFLAFVHPIDRLRLLRHRGEEARDHHVPSV